VCSSDLLTPGRRKVREAASLDFTKSLFRDVKPGDDAAIGKIIFTRHWFYAKRPFATLEMFFSWLKSWLRQ
jgi:hypothetical protein